MTAPAASFHATLFGPELPVNGQPVNAFFDAQALRIQVDAGQELAIPVTALTVTAGGFEHTECFLNWHGQGDSRWLLKPQTSADMEILLQTVPAAFRPQFQPWQRRRHRIRLIWGTLGSIVGVFLLSLILIWWQYDRVVNWAAGHVSLAKERQLGDSLLEQIKESGNVVEQGRAVQALTEIGNKLTQGSAYKYRWLIKKDKDINAYALPGGIILVHSALLKAADNADEVAGVLAHEIQHVEQRHSLKSMINNLGWATVLMAVLGDVNVATAMIIHQAGAMYFSRDIEEEADRLAFKTLLKAQINPSGLVSFFQKLQKQGNQEPPEWISSHPATTERIKNLQNLINAQPCATCKSLGIDWKQVQADKALKIKE